MTPESWRKMEDLYNAARELPAGERDLLLESADPQLRVKVEAMLAEDGSALDRPAWEGMSRSLVTGTFMVPGTQLGPYKIEEQVGSGGMGAVFRAVDSRLGRTVAVKLLHRGRGANPELRHRFLREARAASALSHPNIVVIHDISTDSQGADYLVMEFVQGKTLKDLIGPGGLPLARVAHYGAQVASALGAAHAAGIVHRDVKPANIMVGPDDRVKLLDFGIAKLIEITVSRAAPFQGTQPGVAVGTVAYMSPEQTRGEPVDARSDIFSLGSLLYQAATGQLPFRGASALETMHEIATAKPPPPSALRTDLPGGFDALIFACLGKNPADRPATAGQIELSLRSLVHERQIVLPRSREGRRSVAVLPFKLRTGGPDDEFLSTGLADAIITRLASTGKLLVRPTSSVIRYAGKETEWIQAAREMNVDLVVDGSIQKVGGRVRVLVQAHEVSGANTFYSAKHDGEMGDLFDLQDRSADGICGALVPQNRVGILSRPIVSPTVSTPTYELYMRAADRISRLNKWDTQTAIDLLTEATRLDATFTDAWGRLAQACIQMGVVFDSDPRWFAIAEDAVVKARAMNPDHAEAFCAQGQILWSPTHSFQNQSALRALNAALERNPGCHQAQIWRGLIFFHLGLYEEARLGLEDALAVNPADSRTIIFLAQTALYRGDYEEAYELEKRSLVMDPAGVWQNLFFPTIPLYLGRLPEAAEALSKARQMVPGEATLTSVEGLLAAHEGDFRRAEQLADQSLESNQTLLHTHHLWHNAASVFAMCSKPDKAIPWLIKCVEMGLPNYLLFGSDPHLRSLRNRPEFLSLMSDLRRMDGSFRAEFGLAGRHPSGTNS